MCSVGAAAATAPVAAAVVGAAAAAGGCGAVTSTGGGGLCKEDFLAACGRCMCRDDVLLRSMVEMTRVLLLVLFLLGSMAGLMVPLLRMVVCEKKMDGLQV